MNMNNESDSLHNVKTTHLFIKTPNSNNSFQKPAWKSLNLSPKQIMIRQFASIEDITKTQILFYNLVSKHIVATMFDAMFFI